MINGSIPRTQISSISMALPSLHCDAPDQAWGREFSFPELDHNISLKRNPDMKGNSDNMSSLHSFASYKGYVVLGCVFNH